MKTRHIKVLTQAANKLPDIPDKGLCSLPGWLAWQDRLYCAQQKAYTLRRQSYNMLRKNLARNAFVQRPGLSFWPVFFSLTFLLIAPSALYAQAWQGLYHKQ